MFVTYGSRWAAHNLRRREVSCTAYRTNRSHYPSATGCKIEPYTGKKPELICNFSLFTMTSVLRPLDIYLGVIYNHAIFADIHSMFEAKLRGYLPFRTLAQTHFEAINLITISSSRGSSLSMWNYQKIIDLFKNNRHVRRPSNENNESWRLSGLFIFIFPCDWHDTIDIRVVPCEELGVWCE